MHRGWKPAAKQLSVRFRGKWTEEVGAELFEAALVLPVLLTLLFGIISFGRAYNVYQTITRAAREGARELVLTTCASCSATGMQSYTADQVKTNFVKPAISAANLDASKIDSTYTTTYVWLDPNESPPSICGVKISFDYPYTIDIPFTSQRLSTLTLRAQVQMRLETQPSSCSIGTAVP
ncbi:MAG TPA: TadE family protein [Terriglobia bacterium]|nr:TadE family protein [Terriglobia bacterium]